MILASIFAAYAITLMFIESDGPFGVFYRLRKVKWIKQFGVLECFICTSFWVALAVNFSFVRGSDLIHVFAISGVTILVYKLTDH